MRIFKAPTGSKDPVLWARLEMFSSPERYNALSHVIVFLAQYSERHRESSYCGPFEVEHTKRNKFDRLCSVMLLS